MALNLWLNMKIGGRRWGRPRSISEISSKIKTLIFFSTNQLILIRVKFLCQSVIPGRVMRFIHQGNGNQLFQN